MERSTCLSAGSTSSKERLGSKRVEVLNHAGSKEVKSLKHMTGSKKGYFYIT